jgi:hypothetical protein
VLVNTLPAKYRRVIGFEQEHYTQIGLVMVIVSAIVLSGGSIKQGFIVFCRDDVPSSMFLRQSSNFFRC